jgi:hypothetical protein
MSDSLHKKHGRLSEHAIMGWCAGAFVIVIIYEVLKASQHATLAAPGQHPDIPYTLFWIFDALTAGIVTFALVYVSLSLRRMDENLRDHETAARGILEQLQGTAADVTRLQREIRSVHGDIENVSAGLISKDSILRGLDSENLRKAYSSDSSLQPKFLNGLQKLTLAWGSLIESEFSNAHATVNGTNYGLLCWRVAIQAYLEEEASDIRARTVATNVSLYLKLIESLVDEMLLKTQGTGTAVDLFASASILPVDYFNWCDDKAKRRQSAGIPGISRRFMDDYRSKIKSWMERPNGPTLTRVFLVENLDKPPDEERQLLGGISIPSFEDLRTLAHLKILCDANTGKPRIMTVEQLKTYQDVPQWLHDEPRDSPVYAIAPYFHRTGKVLAADGLKECSLFEVVAGELHSNPGSGTSPNPYARYLEISDEASLEHLKLLPKIPSTRAGDIKSPDFIVIRLKIGTKVHPVVCIAAELDPDFETMALRLITSRDELDEIERFIEYAGTDSTTSGSIGALIQGV